MPVFLFGDFMKKKQLKKSVKKRKFGEKNKTRRACKTKAKSATPGKNVMTGKIDGTGKSYAFFVPDDGSGDLFIAADRLQGAIDGDIVEVRKVSHNHAAGEGEVLRIISSPNSTFIGEVRDGKVLPSLRRMPGAIDILPTDCGVEFIGGDKVVATVVRTRAGLRCKVSERLGVAGKTDVEVMGVIRSYRIEEQFAPEVMAEAALIPDEVTEREKEGREDFRLDDVITIDGAHSKDFDDAICVKKTDEGYRLYVHIADVSEYVTAGSAIDKCAFKRGTSVYFADRVIPMLPEKLCNCLCSLVEGCDRLCLSCIMDFDSCGKMLFSRVTKGVIRSKARTTYDEIYGYICGNAEMRVKFAPVSDMLDNAVKLYSVLNKNRLASGSIEFDFIESEIEVDEKGEVTAVNAAERNDAHKLIEEFMLAANAAVAKKFSEQKIPFVYRVHAAPPPEKLEVLRDVTERFGVEIKDSPAPKDIADMLNTIPENFRGMVGMVALRSMSKAEYKPTNDGHYGLSFADYCHFTSPIRRYPDLAVHRIIKTFMTGGKSAVEKMRDWTAEVALSSSVSERVAEEAERAVDDLLKAKFMSGKIGQKFPAKVSGVTEWGVFAELDNGIEGCIRVEKLHGGLWTFDKKNFALVCGKKSISLGDAVTIRVDSVSGDRIDFSLEE